MPHHSADNRRRGLRALVAMLLLLSSFAVFIPPVAAQDEWTIGDATDLSVTPEPVEQPAEEPTGEQPAEADLRGAELEESEEEDRTIPSTTPAGESDIGAPEIDDLEDPPVDTALWDVEPDPESDAEPDPEPEAEQNPPAVDAVPTAAPSPTAAPAGSTPVPLEVPAPFLIGSGTDAPAQALWDLAGGEPIVLAGYTDTERFDVSLPAGWRAVGDPVFVTSVVASEIARSDASLRVDIAGRPATTWTLADTSNVVLPLEASLLEGGNLQIVATTTSPIIVEPDCIDRDHVGRWVDLGAPRVQADIVPGGLDVARAVRGMAAISELTSEPINVVIRGEISPAVLDAIGAIAAAIGHHGTPSGWVVIQGDGVLPPAGSSIVIEENAAWPGEIAIDTTGLRPVLSLTGAGDDLKRIAHAVADPSRLLFFHQDRVGIAAVPDASQFRSDDVVSFGDAGYADRTVRGSGTQGLVYRIRIPAGVDADSVTLALRGTHAPSLAEREAIFSVSVNGNESEIVGVADSTGRLEVLHSVNPGDMRPGLNFVRVDAQLGHTAGSGCGSVSGGGVVAPEAWLTILDTSAIGVARSIDEQIQPIGVEDTRFALASAADFGQTDVTLPETPSVLDLSLAVRVISDLAARGEGGAPRLVTDQQVNPNRHVMAVGASTGRALLQSLPYSNGEAVGLIVAQPSPFAAGRLFFALTGGTDADAARAAAVAMSPEVAGLTSTMALVSRDTVRELGDAPGIHAAESFGLPPTDLAFTETESSPGPGVEDYEDWLDEQAARVEQQKAPQTQARRAVALGLLLLAAIVGGLWWIRRLRANDDDEAPGH